MSEKLTGYLEVLRVDRAQAIQLVLVGLVLALGVDLIAGYIGTLVSTTEALAIGAVAVAVALALALRSVYQPKPRQRKFVGFFIYDRSENMLAGLDSDYPLGDSLARYLEAGLAEDAQIRAIWERNPIGLLPGTSNETPGDPQRSLDLVRQACEYFVLRSFSTRLSEHFTSGEYAKEELATVSHMDLPDVLLENRFLRTFAEPMENRPTFSPNDQDNDSVIVSQLGGALYERFELVHPKGWRVQRSDKGAIEIETKRFVLRVEPRCEGYATNLPRLYMSHYLGLEQELVDKRLRYSTLEISVSIEIAPRRAWLMTRRGWRYYRWIDQWIADLEPKISTPAYLRKIGYASAETGVLMLRKQEKSKAAVEKPSATRETEKQEEVATAAPGARTPFAVGDEVEHVSFGKGQILNLEPGGVIVVAFDGDEKESRKLMADYAPIRRLIK
jgi:hypothetical protein